MQTIFSQAYDRERSSDTRNVTIPKYSNTTGLLSGLTSTLGGVLSTACFGDAACQENRELQSQAQLTEAQAQLAATNVAAMNEQNEAKNSQVLLYVGVAFMAVVLILGSLFLLKHQS